MPNATDTLIDRIKLDLGHLTMADIRRNWKAGKYPVHGELGRWVVWVFSGLE